MRQWVLWVSLGKSTFRGLNLRSRREVIPTDFSNRQVHHQVHGHVDMLRHLSFQGVWYRLDCSQSVWIQVLYASA